MKIIRNDSLVHSFEQQYTLKDYASSWDQLKKDLVYFSPNETIFQMGDTLDSIYFLVDGNVHISVPAFNGNELFITSLFPCALFGEIEFLRHCPAVSSISAISDVYCFRLPYKKNEQLLEQDCMFFKYVSMTLANRMTDTNNAVIQKASSTLDSRLAHYILQQNSDFEIPVSNLKTICESLHCSYRQLLRILKIFCEKGYLKKGTSRGIYYIANSSGLKDII